MPVTDLALPVHAIHKADWHLRDSISLRLRPYHHLHLKAVAFALRAVNHIIQHRLLIQPERARKIRHSRLQDGICEQIRTSRHKFALQVPAIHSSITRISRPSHDIVVRLLLPLDHLRDELGMVREVGIHDDHEVARRILQTVDVCCSEAEFAGARIEFYAVCAVGFDQLFCDCLGAVGGAVVDD